MDSIYAGDVSTARGRRNAWVDALLIDHAVFRLAWTNFGVVVPGRLYRASHPTPWRLAFLKRRYGIASVINLRGLSRNGADALSRRAAARLRIPLLDIPFKSSQAPSRELLLELIDILRHSPQPMLLHCKSGADRTGFAAGVFLLLEGGNSGQALGQLSLRHGHLGRSRAGILDAVFRQFAREAEGRIGFEEWATSGYEPEAVTARFAASRWSRVLNDRLLRRE